MSNDATQKPFPLIPVMTRAEEDEYFRGADEYACTDEAKKNRAAMAAQQQTQADIMAAIGTSVMLENMLRSGKVER
jgi:hypothetical protein